VWNFASSFPLELASCLLKTHLERIIIVCNLSLSLPAWRASWRRPMETRPHRLSTPADSPSCRPKCGACRRTSGGQQFSVLVRLNASVTIQLSLRSAGGRPKVVQSSSVWTEVGEHCGRLASFQILGDNVKRGRANSAWPLQFAHLHFRATGAPLD